MLVSFTSKQFTWHTYTCYMYFKSKEPLAEWINQEFYVVHKLIEQHGIDSVVCALLDKEGNPPSN